MRVRKSIGTVTVPFAVLIIVSLCPAPALAQTLEERVAALEQQVRDLQAKLQYVTVDTSAINGLKGPHMIFEGVNVHIRSGAGATSSAPNGLGNLVVGYNEPPAGLGARERVGSHNVIIGQQHRYLSFGGLVAGYNNTISGSNACVSAGTENKASGDYASVSGGANNSAVAKYSSVSGGERNEASALAASVSGGSHRRENRQDGWRAGHLSSP
jgi:hypothetical protein